MLPRKRLLVLSLLAGGAFFGCDSTLIFNRSFLNQGTGLLFPLAPGDRSGFILVRGNNTTTVNVEFLITAEHAVESPEDPDQVEIIRESFSLFAPARSRANDVGVLIDCPVLRLGLGQNLDRPTTEAGVFVGAVEVGVGGLGVPANVNPLSSEAGNFDCGDTIIFQVAEEQNAVGGVAVLAFVLDDEALADEVRGTDTFFNARSLIEEQQVVEE